MPDFAVPRLAVGSHRAGTGLMCGMNLISWESGDVVITDFPKRVARPLARLVQYVNDAICTHRGPSEILCPECSMSVVDLAHSTVGTAGRTDEQEAAWWAEVLDSPWGVATSDYLTRYQQSLTRSAALMLRFRAAGYDPTRKEWAKLKRALIASHTSPAQEIALGDYFSIVAAAQHATRYGTYGEKLLPYAQIAIEAWHRLCDSTPAVVPPETTAKALAAMTAAHKDAVPA